MSKNIFEKAFTIYTADFVSIESQSLHIESSSNNINQSYLNSGENQEGSRWFFNFALNYFHFPDLVYYIRVELLHFSEVKTNLFHHTKEIETFDVGLYRCFCFRISYQGDFVCSFVLNLEVTLIKGEFAHLEQFIEIGVLKVPQRVLQAGHL